VFKKTELERAGRELFYRKAQLNQAKYSFRKQEEPSKLRVDPGFHRFDIFGCLQENLVIKIGLGIGQKSVCNRVK